MTSNLVPPLFHSIDHGSSLSVFLANYDHGHFLMHALEALLAQSIQPRAIYVVDDGSADDSVSIIEKYARQHPVIKPVYHPQNRGLFRNIADWLGEVEDEFVYFAAADDMVFPGLFEEHFW